MQELSLSGGERELAFKHGCVHAPRSHVLLTSGFQMQFAWLRSYP